jgi:ribosomal protein S18 acetylase RimI-like enzyme
VCIRPLEYYSFAAKQAQIRKYAPEGLLSSVREDPETVLIASAEMQICGICVRRVDVGLLWLAWIGVSAEFRRQGVATALIETLHASAARRGCHKLWCDCRTVNRESIAFLVSARFRQIAMVYKHWYGHAYFLWEK